jgi:hypothetical protein
VVVKSLIGATDVWAHNRDSINMIIGAILGAYLGLTISKSGLENGSYFDLFNLITFASFDSAALIGMGNQWFYGNRRFAILLAFLTVPFSLLCLIAARNLGVNTGILTTIFVTWAYLILMQIAAFHIGEWFGNRKYD